MTSQLLESFGKIPAEELKCDYCNNGVTHKPLKYQVGMKPPKTILWNIYYCEKCMAEYIVQGFGAPYINLYVNVGTKTYKWAVHDTMGRLYFVGEPGVPGLVPNRDFKYVIGFTEPETVPKITPFNIESKVRLLLMFL